MQCLHKTHHHHTFLFLVLLVHLFKDHMRAATSHLFDSIQGLKFSHFTCWLKKKKAFSHFFSLNFAQFVGGGGGGDSGHCTPTHYGYDIVPGNMSIMLLKLILKHLSRL